MNLEMDSVGQIKKKMCPDRRENSLLPSVSLGFH